MYLTIILMKFLTFFPSDQWVIQTVVGVLGKAMSEASFTTLILFTTELYPTVVRLVCRKLMLASLTTDNNVLRDHIQAAQVYINLIALVFQTERFGLQLIPRAAGCVHIPIHHAIGGRVASPPRSHFLCSCSRIWFSGFSTG